MFISLLNSYYNLGISSLKISFTSYWKSGDFPESFLISIYTVSMSLFILWNKSSSSFYLVKLPSSIILLHVLSKLTKFSAKSFSNLILFSYVYSKAK